MQAIVDPEDIRDFVRKLQIYNSLIADQTGDLQAHFQRLGDTWRDQEHARYAEEFEQAIRVIMQFMRASEEQIPFLQDKARIIEDYLNR